MGLVLFVTAKLLLEVLRLLDNPSIDCTNVGMKLADVARPAPQRVPLALLTRGSELTVGNETFRKKRNRHVGKLREKNMGLMFD